MTDITGDEGDNTLVGTNGDDYIRGLAGDDTLFGNNGNDILSGGVGVNSLTGGEGNDTFLIERRGGDTEDLHLFNTIEDFLTGTNLIDVSFLGVADLETLLPYMREVDGNVHIETYWGHLGVEVPNETIIIRNVTLSDISSDAFVFNTNPSDIHVHIDTLGTLDDDLGYVIFGGNGDDILTVLSNHHDELNGGAGDDILTAGFGDNILRGGIGADTFVMLDRGFQQHRIKDFSQAEGDIIDLSVLDVADLETLMPYMRQEGNDVYIEVSWDNQNIGSEHNEVIIIENASLSSLTTSDFVFNDSADPIILGNNPGQTTTPGYEMLNFSDGYVFFGGNGDDILNRLSGANSDDELNGGAGNDTLNGGRGSNIIRGGSGDDEIIYSETLLRATEVNANFGGNGTDTFRINNLNATDETYAVDLALGQFNYVGPGAQTGFAGDLRGTLDSIENVTITSNANINVRGDDGDNVIIATGLTGVNILQGGAGFDTINGGGGDDIIRGDAGADELNGEDGNDTVMGGAGLDTLNGGAGNDILDGGTQNDILDGGLGADAMTGGSGNDIYYVDNAGDTITELGTAGSGYDIVNTTLNTFFLTDGDNLERVNFQGTGNFTSRGNEGDNRFTGAAGNDRFILDSGGADIFSGGQGRDAFDARSSTNGITIRLDDQSLHAGDAAGDTLASIESFFGSNTAGDYMVTGAARARFSGFGGDDTLIGGASVDFLQGGADDDTLFGNAARDTLQGGTGNDMMSGGSDRDQFLFVEAAFGQDTIMDYEDGLDYLRVFSTVATDISDFIITGNGTSTVTIALDDGTGNNSITLINDDGGNIDITAADFQFYG